VQLAANRPDDLRQAALDVHVHVFQLALPDERSRLNFGQHLVQPAHQRLGFIRRNDAGHAKHPGMGLGPGDVLAIQGPVEALGLGVLLHRSRRGLGETSAPHLLGHGVVSWRRVR
jgi:hypothetical protein